MTIDFIDTEDALFHYTNAKTLFECILFENSFRFSPLELMDDPYDYQCYDLDSKTTSDHISGALEYFHVGVRFNQILNQKLKANCLCINNMGNEIKEFGYDRSRMWSQYGDGHRGVCLVFSKKKILEICLLKFPVVHYGKIEYVKSLSMPHSLDCTDNEYIKDKDNYLMKLINDIKDELLFRKNIDYRDENEFRIYVLEDHDVVKCYQKYLYIPIADVLEGILIGDRFHETYMPLLYSYKEKYNYFIKKIKYNNGNLNIDFVYGGE